MRRKFLGNTIRAILCCSMLLLLCGCSKDKTKTVAEFEPMEIEQVDKFGFDFLGGEDVMPIAGYFGPTPSEMSFNGVAVTDLVTDEVFKAIAESGVNIIEYSRTDYGKSPNYALKMLELGEKYNIGVVLEDSYITTKLGKDSLSLSEIDERINKYCDYPAFCGLYGVDEPNSDGFCPEYNRPISNYVNNINRLEDLGVWSYTNLLPLYDKNKRDKYAEYVDEFLSTCDAKILQWDHYVWDEGREKTDYFYNLSICREKATEYDVPFWTFVQTGSQWNDAMQKFDTNGYYPNEAQFMWNVNTCLAYGSKGISYFPLVQPYWFSYAETQQYDFERNGMIGASGNKNRWWYYAQNVNKQIAAVDEVLMNSVNKGILVTGEQAIRENKDSSCVLEGHSWRELINITGDTMVGCFNYQGKSAYYVVNYDTEYSQNITLEFFDKCKFTVTQNAEKSKLHGQQVTLTMKPGEGVLVVMD